MRILLADDNRSRRDQLRSTLLGEGLACNAADAVQLDMLAGRLAQSEHDLVLVACDSPSDSSLAAIRTAHNVTGAPILATGHVGDANPIRDAVRAGARGYLDIDRFRDELADALANLEGDGRVPSERGKVISLFSPNGGAGVSTAAINLAARLSSKKPGRTALVDLKPAPSDLSLLLDVQPQHTLDALCRRAATMDRRMVAAVMTRHGSGVDVLPQAGFPAEGGLGETPLDRGFVRSLLTLLPRMYTATVLDLDHTLAAEQVEAMRLSNFVGLIVRPDLPGLRRARWALDTLGQLGLSRDRFRLIVSRLGSPGQIPLARAEEILGIEIFQSIPEDSKSVNRAVNQGTTLADVAKLSRISRSFSSFARSVQTL